MLCACIDYVSVGVVRYVVVCVGTILKYMSRVAAVRGTTHSVQITGEKEVNQLKRYLDVFNMDIGYLINISYKDFEIIEVHGKERFDPVSY